jgi:trehalose 6-phosphate phosphatase
LTALAAVAAPFVADPSRAALLFDVDGTLAPIVTDPDAARPLSAAVDRLRRLAVTYRLVGAVSGRSVAFLAEHLPPGLALSGLYGLETLVDGVLVDHPEADRWRPAIASAAARALREGPDAMVVEPKGLSITLHYRTDPSLEDEVLGWAHTTGQELGLEVRPAKMSVELHPPIDSDKGTALEELVGDSAAVLYAGDDRGDLPAFDALDRLAARGVHTARVAVGSHEAPPELVARADLVLPDPDAVVALLDALTPRPDRGSASTS